MKLRIICLIFFSLTFNSIYGQTQNYHSSKYNYSIDIPNSFQKGQSRSLNNDLLFSDISGASINMIVVPHDPQIKSPHELSKEMFYSIFRDIDPNVKIFDDQKIVINEKKVFKHVRTIKFKDTPDQLNQVCFTYFDGDKQFILTLACATFDYQKYKTKFDAVGKSVKFK